MIVTQQAHREHQAAARTRRHRAERPMKVTVDHDGAHYIVTVSGQVDRPTITEFSGTVRGLVAVGIPELTVDLGACWEGARLLTVLARTRRALIDRGGRLHLVGVVLPEYLAALRDAPLDEVFLVYDAVRRLPAQRTVSPTDDDACDEHGA